MLARATAFWPCLTELYVQVFSSTAQPAFIGDILRHLPALISLTLVCSDGVLTGESKESKDSKESMDAGGHPDLPLLILPCLSTLIIPACDETLLRSFCCPVLSHFVLSGPMVLLENLNLVPAFAPDLRWIDISDCNATLAAPLPSLPFCHVDLWDLPKLTNANLLAFLRCCPELVDVHIVN